MRRTIVCVLLVMWLPLFLNGQSIGIRGWVDEEVRGLAGQVLSDQGGGVPYAYVFLSMRKTRYLCLVMQWVLLHGKRHVYRIRCRYG